jgi:TolB-like protein/tetratricopeptide (TPR) repeat protein/predicted Ser/Thr protein kinase
MRDNRYWTHFYAAKGPRGVGICLAIKGIILYSRLAPAYNGKTPEIRTFRLVRHVAKSGEGSMIGRTISHYKILEKLGEGGMGVVYKAEDTKLKRIVALKFLSAQVLGTDEEKTRFIHEAQAAAALNHPNICTVHEIDDAEGQPFIALEYIEGQSLKAKIESGPFPFEEAVDTALQIAEGLRSAHRRKMIHRDVKSANIMITAEGRVKIMDFGLAKSPGRTQLTREGTTLGTVAYMSPEQGRGDVVDARSDVWSLGVVLYEMVSGRLPFKGSHEQAIMYSVINEEPTPLTALRSDVPLELERIVGKCLEKQPSRRYQGVDDLLVDLIRLGAELGDSQALSATRLAPRAKRGRTGWLFAGMAAVILIAVFVLVVYPRYFRSAPDEAKPGMKKLAVLFFENLGPKEDEYFANGITDAITARLQAIHGLGVISRQSTIQYKDSKKSIPEIGNELGADYILEGTIQRERPGDPSSRVRIIPQLISVSDDIHLWADTYDEDMTEVFRVQSDIAERVAHALDVTLRETEREVLGEVPTDNLEAYEYYLRGNEYFFGSDRYSLEGSRKAVQMYERATELDPEFTAAWTGLSKASIWAFYTLYSSNPNRKTAAKAAVDRARELDPDSPDVQTALGYYYYYGSHDFNRALQHLDNARSSLPNDVEVLNVSAFIKRRQGKWDESVALLEKAADLNPRYFASALELGVNCVTMRQYDKAERLLDRSIFLAPQNSTGPVFKIMLYLLRDGNTERARETLVKASEFVKPAQLGFDMEAFAPIRLLPETYAELLNRAPPEEYGIEDTTFFYLGVAEMYHQLGMEEQARVYWGKELDYMKSSRSPVFQEELDLCLGLAYVGLGRKEEAVRLAREAIADAPLSSDAFVGAYRLEMAALIFVRTGMYEKAIDQLEVLLSIPSETSRALYRIDPAWDPLRDHPRFRKLVEGES